MSASLSVNRNSNSFYLKKLKQVKQDVVYKVEGLAHNKPREAWGTLRGLGYTKTVWSQAGSPGGVANWREVRDNLFFFF